MTGQSTYIIIGNNVGKTNTGILYYCSPQKAKKTANTPEQKTRGFKLEIELFADFLPESITKKEAIERITEALRQFNEYSGATTGRT